jgi:hypothetical protein
MFDMLKSANRSPVMKVTIEIPDALLREARKLMAREGITVSALMERGLRRVLTEAKPSKKPSKKPFKLRDGRFEGNGLRPELRGASWAAIRALSYGE